LFVIGILGFGISAYAANSFVDGFKGIEVVDTTVDNLGVTYVLGKDSANSTLIWKYDAAGASLHWITNATYPLTNVIYRTNSSLKPLAFCVAPGASATTNLSGTTNIIYVVGQDSSSNFKIVRLLSDTGEQTASLTDGSSFIPKSVIYAGSSVYVCGNYNSTSIGTLFNVTSVNPRGSQAALVVRLDPNLPSSGAALNLTTFGGNAGGNTAESLAVDEAGDVYVAGHLDPCVF